MKTTKSFALASAAALLLAISHVHGAAIDNNYYVVDSTTKSRFEVYNDGKNTYVEAIPGLVVRGATADGQRYIVNGVPAQIAAQLNGKQITVMRGYPPPPPVVKPAPVDTKAVLSRIEEISSSIKRLQSASGVTDADPVADGADAAAAPKDEEWIVPHGASLRDTVAQFAARANWVVDIKFNDVQTGEPSDLIISGGQKIVGSFKTAIRETFSTLPESSGIVAELRPDNNPPTLFIYRKGSVK